MVTQTTPSRAKVPPSYTGTAPEPLTNAPPWIHTKTGSPEAVGSGVQTFRLRQSSPGICGSGSKTSYGGAYGGLGTVGPYSVAGRTPSQGSGGSGAAKRRRPNGGAAYGMPRKADTPSRVVPRTAPLVVRTVGSV